MVGEEGEPARKRGVGHRSSLRRQDSAHTGRYGDTLILPTSARRHLRRASAALTIRSSAFLGSYMDISGLLSGLLGLSVTVGVGTSMNKAKRTVRKEGVVSRVGL